MSYTYRVIKRELESLTDEYNRVVKSGNISKENNMALEEIKSRLNDLETKKSLIKELSTERYKTA